jgi:hypothetical protein
VALLYPDDLIWWFRGTISGSPTVVTLPNTPTVGGRPVHQLCGVLD